MTIASFFSGIGGLELGLERAGLGKTVFQCEKDPYALRVLERHWPDVPRHTDITSLQPDDIPHADVWCGGFPCQDISVAGKGAGIYDGSRSSLWWEWFRLIRLVRPPVVVVENVAAFLGRGLLDVLGSFAEAGYDAEWETFGASDVGAPHRRKRVFVIGTDSNGTQFKCDGGINSEHCSTRRQQRAARRLGCSLADAHDAGLEGWHGVKLPERPGERAPGESGTCMADSERLRELQPQGSQCDQRRRACYGGWWSIEPDVGRVADGIPNRVDRLKCLGNAVVPQCAEIVGRRVLAMMGSQ